MKSKIHRNQSCGATIDYVFDAAKHGGHKSEYIDGTTVGDRPQIIRAEFAAVRDQRADIGKPLEHISLALPQGDHLTTVQWSTVIRDYLRGMGIDADQMQWFAVRHKDKKHEHVHLLINRIMENGKVWDNKNDVYHSIDVCSRLERRYPDILRNTTNLNMTDWQLRLTKAEQIRKQHGEVILREIIYNVIRKVLLRVTEMEGKSTPQAFARLVAKESRGTIDVRASLSKSGAMQGFSFAIGKRHCTASQIQRRLRWSELSKYIDYAPIRDAQVLKRLDPNNPSYQKAQIPVLSKIHPSTGFVAGVNDVRKVLRHRIIVHHCQPKPEEQRTWYRHDLPIQTTPDTVPKQEVHLVEEVQPSVIAVEPVREEERESEPAIVADPGGWER